MSFDGNCCSICGDYCDWEGGWLRGGLQGPFSHWVCLDCDDWIHTLLKPKDNKTVRPRYGVDNYYQKKRRE